MKKGLCMILSACISCLMLTGCGDGKNGTYYPDDDEMMTNLENAQYSIKVSNRVDEDGKFTGSHLSAQRENGDYIEFYWLDDEQAVDVIGEKLESKYSDSYKFVSIKNDKKFGSIVFCATESAVNDAGIKIVEVTESNS
ncbi:MAG: hypothetical protein K2G63_05575 [Oscillospiraceae bacterium]|nr:hypothetical protein [Oscillospiraceae bacterium]